VFLPDRGCTNKNQSELTRTQVGPIYKAQTIIDYDLCSVCIIIVGQSPAHNNNNNNLNLVLRVPSVNISIER